MAKRDHQRERERQRALRRQEKAQIRARKQKRNQIIGSIVAAVVVVAGIVYVAWWVQQPAKNTTAPPTTYYSAPPTETPEATATEAPTPAAELPPGTPTEVPDKAVAEDRDWTGTLKLNDADLGIKLDGKAAPQAVANFIELAKVGYYDDVSCHRLTTEGIYVLQCGSRTGDGTDDPGYKFGPLENVPADGVYKRGVLAMARAAAEDSMGAQFFIVYKDSTLPAPGYTVFGEVTSGLEAVDAIAEKGVSPDSSNPTDGKPAEAAVIKGIELQ